MRKLLALLGLFVALVGASLIGAPAAVAATCGDPDTEFWGPIPPPQYTDWRGDGPNHWRRDYQSPGRICGESGTYVVLEDQPFICNGPVDIDFVKVTQRANDDALILAAGCTGRIGRIEVETYTKDGVKVQNASANAAHNFTIESGYVHCLGSNDGAHQDGMQVMGGRDILVRGVEFSGCETQSFFVNRAGSGATTPTDVVCDGCVFKNAAHTDGPATPVNVNISIRSGIRNSTVCRSARFGRAANIRGTYPVNENNVILPVGDPACA